MKRFQSADLACLLMTLIWGSNLSVLKHALTEISPMSFNALRLALGAVALAAITWVLEGRIEFQKRHWGLFAVFGFLGNTLYQALFIEGVDRTKAGNVALLLSTATVFIALLSWLVGHERLTKLVWGGILLSLSGVTLILLESSSLGVSGGSVGGDLLIVSCSLCWAAYTVYARSMMRTYSALSFTTVTFGIGTVFFVLIATPQLLAEDWGRVSATSFVELALSALMALSVGYALWFFAVSRLGSTRASIYNNLIPFVGVLVAWLFLGESITLPQLAGGSCVLTGIYLTRLRGI